MNTIRTIKSLLLLGVSLIAAPALVASVPEPPQVTISSPSYGRYRVEWPSQAGRTYFVQWSEDLETWSYYPAILSGPGTLYFEDTPTDGQGAPLPRFFFRLAFSDIPIAISKELDDFDGDGVSNWNELTLTNTNPLDWDTDDDGEADYFTDSDGDGLPDMWEREHFGDLTTADPNADSDEDGLTNAQESRLRSDPDSTDTDNDGLSDAEDASPANTLIDWHKTPTPLFILDELPIEDISGLILEDFSENGTVLFLKSPSEGPATRIVVDREGTLHPPLPIEPSQLGEFGCDCPTLFDDRLFGVRREEEPGLPDGANRDRLWDPLPGADPEYAPHPEFGDFFPGHHDGILEVRGDFRAEHRSGQPMPFDIATPYGSLADTENVLRATIERKGNIVLPREYWPFRPESGEDPAAYPTAMPLPRLSTFRSSTLRQRSVRDGQETLWHLVCSKWDIFHPFTAKDLMLSKNGAAFQPADLDGAACRTLLGSGHGWLAAKRSIWCNGIWTPLKDITAKDANITDIRLLDIMDTGTGVARIKLDDGTEKFALIRLVRVVELHPKLRDEEDEITEGTQYPDPIPESNAMVERDPEAAPTPLPDASAIRIAWRDMKVEVGKPHAGKTITWSMTPRFTPYHVTAEHPEGEPEDDPRFRGKWGTAANATCRNRFSASAHYDPTNEKHHFAALDPVAEEDTGVQVHQRATTTVDEDGYTAIRVNLPPIGFNKARIRIEIAGLESYPVGLTDLEVPAVVVIDPGHGGLEAPPSGGSSWNNATSFGIDPPLSPDPQQPGESWEDYCERVGKTLEKDLTLLWGLELRSQLRAVMRSNHHEQKRILMTRTTDENPTIAERPQLARQNGADVFFSIHFNGHTTTTIHGPETWIETESAGNVNHAADLDLAELVQGALDAGIPNAQQPGQTGYRGIKEGTVSGVFRDNNLGNQANQLPHVRACLAEIDWITNQDVEISLISGTNAATCRETAINAIAEGLTDDIERQE